MKNGQADEGMDVRRFEAERWSPGLIVIWLDEDGQGDKEHFKAWLQILVPADADEEAVDSINEHVDAVVDALNAAEKAKGEMCNCPEPTAFGCAETIIEVVADTV